MEGKGHDYKHYLYSESLLKITSSQKNLPEEGVKTQKHTHTQTHTLSERDGKLKAKTETEEAERQRPNPQAASEGMRTKEITARAGRSSRELTPPSLSAAGRQTHPFLEAERETNTHTERKRERAS